MDPEEHAAIFDEALDLVRRAWSGESIEHDGTHFQVHGFRLTTLPAQGALDVWLGGVAPSELPAGGPARRRLASELRNPTRGGPEPTARGGGRFRSGKIHRS